VLVNKDYHKTFNCNWFFSFMPRPRPLCVIAGATENASI